MKKRNYILLLIVLVLSLTGCIQNTVNEEQLAKLEDQVNELNKELEKVQKDFDKYKEKMKTVDQLYPKEIEKLEPTINEILEERQADRDKAAKEREEQKENEPLILEKTKREKLLDRLDNMVYYSNGNIKNIQPAFIDNDWSTISVVVGEAWYNSREDEKQAFIEDIDFKIKGQLRDLEIIDDNKAIMIYFYNTNNIEIATPKMTGGHKIK